MVNTNVQETMLLLAETLTIGSESKQVDEAITLYTRVLESRMESGEPVKDIHRALAPLYTLQEKFEKANECLKKVLEDED